MHQTSYLLRSHKQRTDLFYISPSFISEEVSCAGFTSQMNPGNLVNLLGTGHSEHVCCAFVLSSLAQKEEHSPGHSERCHLLFTLFETPNECDVATNRVYCLR